MLSYFNKILNISSCIGLPFANVRASLNCVCVADADTLLLCMVYSSFFLLSFSFFFLFHFSTEICARFNSRLLETSAIDLKLRQNTQNGLKCFPFQWMSLNGLCLFSLAGLSPPKLMVSVHYLLLLPEALYKGLVLDRLLSLHMLMTVKHWVMTIVS